MTHPSAMTVRTKTMQDQDLTALPDLSGLEPEDWLDELAAIGTEEGFFEPLGPKHRAVFLDRSDTLLVTFQSREEVAEDASGLPAGFAMMAAQGWSQLVVLSDGNTWFRAPEVYDFFDKLIDDGFFDEFENVLFFGAGPGGYAAAAYSVAAPGASVLALQPQASLAPDVAEWDLRFRAQRRVDFSSRYAYAPDMLDAADRAVVLYDPNVAEDAMHSALFRRPNVARYRLPFMGDTLLHDLKRMQILVPLLQELANKSLTRQRFGQIARARRDHTPYLRRLLGAVDAKGRDDLALMLCRNVVSRLNAPRFRRRLRAMETTAKAG